MTPLVSITIVTRNKFDMAMRCIKSIIKYTNVPVDLMIVDNGSTGDFIEFFKKFRFITQEWKEANPNILNIEFIQFNSNRYICEATNVGFKDRLGQYYLFVPSDTIMTENYLTTLLGGLEKYKLEGISPRWFESKHLDTVESPDIFDPFDWANSWATRFRESHGMLFHNRENCLREDCERGWIVGICYLIKKEVWQQVGEWDQNYKLTVMDNDFNWRALAIGFKLGIVNSAWIYHVGPATRMDEKENPTFHQIGNEDWKYFMTKWGTDPDDHNFLFKIVQEGKIRKKTLEDGPNTGISEEEKRRRMTL